MSNYVALPDLIDTPDRTDFGKVSHFFNPNRDSINRPAVFTSVREFLSGDVEAVAIKLGAGESFKGGGRGRKNADKSEMSEDDLKRSQRRARINVRRACLSYCPDRLLTLTFKDNVTDIKKAWSIFKKFNDRMRRRFPDRWRYVVVPEYQKRGAVHFHLAIDGYYNVNIVRYFWLKACGHLKGNIDITSPRTMGKNSWNPKRIANYVAKYITKNDSVLFNAKRYAKGGDIPEPKHTTGYASVGVAITYILQTIFDAVSPHPHGAFFHTKDWREIAFIST